MKTATRSAVVLAAASLAIFAQACTLASPTHITEQPSSDADDSNGDAGTASTSPTGTGATASGASTCANPTFTKPDVSTLTACGSGKGHCYGASKVPNGATMFGADTCSSGQLCVPDEVISANGGKLATCTVSLLSKPGACIDLALMPAATAQGGSALKADGCAGGLTCVPCTNPLDGSDTGICDAIGVTSTDCTAAAGATTGSTTTTTTADAVGCCTTNGVSNGQCIPSSAVPSGSSGMAPQDSCATGNSCVPKALVSGAPQTCSSDLAPLGGGAICLDTCFASGIKGDLEGAFLGQDVCGSTERCVPCSMIKLAAGSTPVPGCN